MRVRTATYIRLANPETDAEKLEKRPVIAVEESHYNELVEEAKKAGVVEPEPLLVQTFLMKDAENDGDINILTPDERVRTSLHNRAGSLRQLSEIRSFIEDADWKGVEGNFDVSYTLAEFTERKKLSPQDKAVKALIGLGMTEEAARAVIANYTQPAA